MNKAAKGLWKNPIKRIEFFLILDEKPRLDLFLLNDARNVPGPWDGFVLVTT